MKLRFKRKFKKVCNTLIALLTFLICSTALAESRFGELTYIKDKKMRGKDNQWVRPHPGPFVWSFIEQDKGNFVWDETDKHMKYSQERNQKILATIWPYAEWDQKTCNKKKKGRPPFKGFPKRMNKPCSMPDYLNFLSLLVDRYDGDGNNDMPGLTTKITHWEIMNEPEFKMFFKGTEDEFVEIFIASSKLIREKQKDSVIVMAGAAAMYPENKKFWSSALPKIKDYFDIANIHHISGPDGQCDKDFWVGEFSELLASKKIDKPIWVTEAMTCGPPVKAYINAFSKGAEVIIDVGVNAPGAKMSKKGRKKLNEFIEKVDGFKSIKIIKKNESAEFTMQDGSKKIIEY